MGMNAYVLTTLQNAKDHLRVPNSTDDNLIERMIEAATGIIETYCGRHFATRAWTDRLFDGTGDEFLILDEYPVTAVTRVSEGRSQVISVTNTRTDATRATVALSSTGATLTILGGAVAGMDALTWAASTTLTAVVAAINALGKGWAAAASSAAYGSYVSTELIECPARDCLNGTIYLEIPSLPGVSDYVCHWDEGILERTDGTWGRGSKNITVDYTAGYVLVPDDIEGACLDIVAAMYGRLEHDPAMRSESLGDYSYTLADLSADMPEAALASIRRYKDRRF